MDNAQSLRRIAVQALAENSLSNPVRVRSTTFGCDRHGGCYVNVTINEWEPNPVARLIERQIKALADHAGFGALVTFSGGGFIQN